MITDQEGRELRTIADKAAFGIVRSTRDGSQILVSRIDPRIGTEDVEMYSITRPTRTRITFEPEVEFHAVLSPDGSQLFYASDQKGIPDIYVRSIDGTEAPRLLVEQAGEQQPCDISPDGSKLLYVSVEAQQADLWIQPTAGGKPYKTVATPGRDRCGRFSPDGQAIAYQSDVSGRGEIYVKTLEGRTPPVQVTTEGGVAPAWSHDGQTIFFLGPDDQTFLSASRSGASFSDPRLLFTHPKDVDSYDLIGASNQFVLIERDEMTASPPLHVVLRWSDSLEKR